MLDCWTLTIIGVLWSECRRFGLNEGSACKGQALQRGYWGSSGRPGAATTVKARATSAQTYDLRCSQIAAFMPLRAVIPERELEYERPNRVRWFRPLEGPPAANLSLRFWALGNQPAPALSRPSLCSPTHRCQAKYTISIMSIQI